MHLYSNQWTIYSFTYVYINNYRRYGLAIPCGSFWKIRDSVNTCTRQCQLDARPLGGSWPSWTSRKLDQLSSGCRSYPGRCLRRSEQPSWTGGPNPKDPPFFLKTIFSSPVFVEGCTTYWLERHRIMRAHNAASPQLITSSRPSVTVGPALGNTAEGGTHVWFARRTKTKSRTSIVLVVPVVQHKAVAEVSE